MSRSLPSTTWWNMDKDGKDKSITAKTISLLVTPAQAAKVTLACEMGKIRLVMRGPEDNAHAEDASAKPEELLGHSAYSDRNKEAADLKKTDNKSGFLDLLSQIKAKPAVKQAPEPPSTISWTMRILQPNGINDVVLESDNSPAAGNPGLGHWRRQQQRLNKFRRNQCGYGPNGPREKDRENRTAFGYACRKRRKLHPPALPRLNLMRRIPWISLQQILRIPRRNNNITCSEAPPGTT